MKVDFNNLRTKLGKHYNSVIESLNNQDHTDIEFENQILRNKLDDLRSDIVGIICCYEEGNPDCIVIDMDILSAFKEED